MRSKKQTFVIIQLKQATILIYYDDLVGTGRWLGFGSQPALLRSYSIYGVRELNPGQLHKRQEFGAREIAWK